MLNAQSANPSAVSVHILDEIRISHQAFLIISDEGTEHHQTQIVYMDLERTDWQNLLYRVLLEVE